MRPVAFEGAIPGQNTSEVSARPSKRNGGLIDRTLESQIEPLQPAYPTGHRVTRSRRLESKNADALSELNGENLFFGYKW